MPSEERLHTVVRAPVLLKQALLAGPAFAGSMGRAMLDIQHGNKLQGRTTQLYQDMGKMNPQDRQGAEDLAQSYKDVPHEVYSQAIGAKPTGPYAQLALRLPTAFLPYAGAGLGLSMGPLGIAAGAGLGALGGHMANRGVTRALNANVLRKVLNKTGSSALIEPSNLLYNIASAALLKEAADPGMLGHFGHGDLGYTMLGHAAPGEVMSVPAAPHPLMSLVDQVKHVYTTGDLATPPNNQGFTPRDAYNALQTAAGAKAVYELLQRSPAKPSPQEGSNLDAPGLNQ